MMSEREKALAIVEAKVSALKTAPSNLDLEVRRLEREARQRLADLRGLVRRHPEEGRRLLEALLAGPLTFTPEETPEGRRFKITGKAGLLGSGMSSVPSGIRTLEKRQDPQESRRHPHAGGELTKQTATDKCAERREPDESRTKPEDPRTVLLRQLAEGMREALAAGDVEAARIAHETIGRLLGAQRADTASVVELAAERARRGG